MKKMTRKELAKLINISVDTMSNWEKNKPELVKLINLGLRVDQQREETKKLLEKLEEIEKVSSSGKFELK